MGLIVVFLFTFSPLILKGRLLAGGDLINQYIPYKYFWRDTFLKFKEIPLWNPHHFCGRQFQADIQTGVFYPPNWLILFFSPEVFFTIITLLHILWGMIGMAKYIRILSKNTFLMSLGGILFGLSGFNLTRLANFSGVVLFIFTASWIPWILFFEECFFSTRKAKHLLFFIIMLTFQLFAGSPQIAFYTGIALFFIIFFQAVQIIFGANEKRFKAHSSKILYNGIFSKDLKGFLTGILIAFILDFSLFGIQFFPTLDFMKNSFERGRGASFEYIASDSLLIPHLITYIIPKYFYDPASEEIYSFFKTGFHEFNFYLGVSPLFFFSLYFLFWTRARRDFEKAISGCFVARKRGRIAFSWICLCVFGILSALGSSSPLFRLLYYFIPGFKFFRVPARFMIFYWICAIVLTILTIDILIKLCSTRSSSVENPLSGKNLKKHFFITLLITFFIYCALIIFLLLNPTGIYDFFGITQNLFFQGIKISSPYYEKIIMVSKSSSLRSLLLLISTFFIIILFFAKMINQKIFQLLIFITISFDLLSFGSGFIYAVPKDKFKANFYPETEIVKFLKQNLKNGERYLWLDDVFDYRFDQNQLEIYANRSMVFNLNEMRGYDPNFLRWYGEFINIACNKPTGSSQGAFLSLTDQNGFLKINTQLLSLFNLKYILTYQKISLYNFKVVKEIHFGGQTLQVYENLSPSGRIYLRKNANENHPGMKITLTNPEFNPEIEAIPSVELPEIKSFTRNYQSTSPGENIIKEKKFYYECILDKPNHQVYRVSTSNPGILIFAENFDNGWRVKVNGVLEEYFPVNHTFGGIFLKPGEWKIEIVYYPVTLIRGALLSFAGALLFIFLLLKSKERYQKP